MTVEQDVGPAVETQPWFALRVRPSCERVASTYLKACGYEEFAPTYQVTRQWTDRKKKTDLFLFPGYVFCRLDPHKRLPALMAPGVMHILSFGNVPAEIPDDEIARIQAMVRSGVPLVPWPHLEVGDMVLLERGPLAGLEGRLERIKGQYRIVVSLKLLQQAVSAEVEWEWVRPLKKAASRISGSGDNSGEGNARRTNDA